MSPRLVSSGIPALDRLVGGGLPHGGMVVVRGEHGTGKTVLAIHFAWEALQRDGGCIFLTTEGRGCLLDTSRGLSMDLSQWLDRRLVVVDALESSKSYTWGVDSFRLRDVLKTIIDAYRYLRRMKVRRIRLVIDSLTPFAVGVEERVLWRSLMRLRRLAAKLMEASLLTVQGNGGWVEPCLYVADVVLRLDLRLDGAEPFRVVQVEKCRGLACEEGPRRFSIVPRKGIVVEPREGPRFVKLSSGE